MPKLNHDTLLTQSNPGKKLPIKILYVIGQLTVGGTERQLLELIKHIDRTNFDLQVVSLYQNAPLKMEFREAGCPVHLLNREKQGRLVTLVRLYQILRSLHPHVVHTFAYASRAAIPAARAIGDTKVIVSIRTNPLFQASLQDNLANSFADQILCNTKTAKAIIDRKWRHNRIKVIYNGIWLPEFDVMKKKSVNLPIGAQANNANICCVARLVPVKGLDQLLEAFVIVDDSLPDANLWIIGGGPLRSALERNVARLGLYGNIVFWGTRADVPAILGRCDIGVISSHAEGMCNAILEYMSAGLPVVATSVGGNPELVIHGETGLLVPPRNPTALAEALIFLMLNPEAANRMGESGRKRVEEKFTIERMVRDTEETYFELLPGIHG